MTLWEFPMRFLERSFHICNRSSWLVVFSFALEVLFFLLTSFTVCHDIRDCLYPSEFLILINSLNIFFLLFVVCVNSLCASLSFSALAFVRFLLLHKDTFFTLSLGLVGRHSVVASMWALTVFIFFIRIICFGYLLKSIVFISHSYRIFRANISIGKWGPVVCNGFDCF